MESSLWYIGMSSVQACHALPREGMQLHRRTRFAQKHEAIRPFPNNMFKVCHRLLRARSDSMGFYRNTLSCVSLVLVLVLLLVPMRVYSRVFCMTIATIQTRPDLAKYESVQSIVFARPLLSSNLLNYSQKVMSQQCHVSRFGRGLDSDQRRTLTVERGIEC